MSNVSITLEGRRKILKGVSRSGKRFRADLYHKSRKIYIGTYDTALDAAFAYDDFVMTYVPGKKTNFKKDPR